MSAVEYWSLRQSQSPEVQQWLADACAAIKPEHRVADEVTAQMASDPGLLLTAPLWSDAA